VHPHCRQSKNPIFRAFLLGGDIWRMGVVNLAVLGCVLRATTLRNKKSSTFSRKVHSPEKILATPISENDVTKAITVATK